MIFKFFQKIIFKNNFRKVVSSRSINKYPRTWRTRDRKMKNTVGNGRFSGECFHNSGNPQIWQLAKTHHKHPNHTRTPPFTDHELSSNSTPSKLTQNFWTIQDSLVPAKNSGHNTQNPIILNSTAQFAEKYSIILFQLKEFNTHIKLSKSSSKIQLQARKIRLYKQNSIDIFWTQKFKQNGLLASYEP